jgi:two-component system, cell cycle sensor histidine kinase and response regulator CckA
MLRVPLTENNLLASQVLRGKAALGDLIEGVDYQGVPVMGVARAIPGTDWFLVAKMDQAEAHAEANREALWIALTGLLALFMAGAGSFLYRQHQELAFSLRERETQAERLHALELLDAIAEGSGDAIFAKDREGRYLLFNREGARLMGKTPQEVLGLDDLAIFPPEQAKFVIANDLKVIEDNRTITFQEDLTTADGEITFLSTKGPLHDAAGNVIGTFGISRDITERKRAEEALRESELRWQFALEGAGDGLWDWNVETNEVFFSRQWKAMLGFGEHEITHMLDEWEKRIHPEDKERVHTDLAKHLDGHTPVYINEHRMLCKDGTYKWILDRGRVISWTKDGKPLRVIGTHSDISERKRSEEALQESEKRLRRAELVAQVGNWEFVLDTAAARGSDGARAIYGIGEGNWSIPDVQKIPLPEYRPMLDKALQELIEAGKPYNVEFKIRRPTDGKILDIHSIAEYSSGKRIVFGVIQDITDRKHAEEALRASEEKYRQVVENAHDAIFIAQDGFIKFPNPRLATMSGYSLEELTQNPFLDFVHPDDRELVAKTHQKRMQGEEVPFTYSFQAVNKSGHTLWVELGSVFLSWEGRPASLNFLRDITVEKKLESQLVHAQKMEAVGTLAGGIAHDFNNLLQAVQGYAELLLRSKTEGEPGSRELQEIVRAVRRGGELTRQLLTFSRKVESKLQPIDLNRIVEDVRSLLERTIPKMIKIEIHLTGNLHHVNADASQVEQVLMNLAVNARDAMPNGGTLRIETKDVVLNEESRHSRPELSPGKYVLLAVADTGQGMDKTTLENIFNPFFTTKEVGKGTGLGLAMVYGIVKNHHGHITCMSKPGGGTTFEICLPAVEHSDRASTIVTGTEDLRGGHETVLLVDDDDSLRDLGQQILQAYGYTVLSTPDGEGALQVYQEFRDRIDLVVLDLIMPGMGGALCLQKLLEINPTAKIIIASGYSFNGETESATESGAKAFIQKPYDVQQMLQAVRGVLDG